MVVVLVDVEVVTVLVVDVDVEVEVLVDVDVLVVVVSHPVHVLSHCFAIAAWEHSPAARMCSHWGNGETFLLLAHR